MRRSSKTAEAGVKEGPDPGNAQTRRPAGFRKTSIPSGRIRTGGCREMLFLRISWILLIPAILCGQEFALEDIRLYGQVRTPASVILRELRLKPGMPLDPSLLNTERDWLVRLDFLRRIDFLTRAVSDPDRRTLMIVVSEKPRFTFYPSAGWDALFGISAGVMLASDNLSGRRETLRIRARFGGIREGRLLWSNPWMAGSLRLFTELDLGYTGFRYLYDDFEPDFFQEVYRFRWTLGRRFGRRVRIGFRGGWDRVVADDPDALVSRGGRDTMAELGLTGEWDTRDWPFYPGRGVYAKAAVARTRLPDGRILRETDADLRGYLTLRADHILAFQTVVHIADGPVPVCRRVHFNDGALRGYRTGSFWGENSLTASLEYRLPLHYERNPSANLHAGTLAVFFADAGAAWLQSDRSGWKRLHGAAGFGIHAVWQRWVLRAEYGVNRGGRGFLTAGTDVRF
ncbi:MAG TPA: hypothetical protein ENN17_01675 [bacterium]|nr:hypothetical protein [bacterium]